MECSMRSNEVFRYTRFLGFVYAEELAAHYAGEYPPRLLGSYPPVTGAVVTLVTQVTMRICGLDSSNYAALTLHTLCYLDLRFQC